jgi:hypothetical protein
VGFPVRYFCKYDWAHISIYQTLSEEFIREFQDNLIWRSIWQYQKLSEVFIREYQSDLDWYTVSRFQRLSDDFIIEFKDKIFGMLIFNTNRQILIL